MIAFRKHTWNRYKELIGECSNLDCKHYTQLEAHHIIPIAAGGLDEFDNIIILCKTCHMNGNYHSDWVLHQDELHKWKGEVDSHIIYELQQKQLIDDDCYYTENNTAIKKPEEFHRIINDEIVNDAEPEKIAIVNEPKQIRNDEGIIGKCWECHKRETIFKFKNGMYCIRCIEKHYHLSMIEIDDLTALEAKIIENFVFKPKIFANLFKEYDPVKCAINRKNRESK